MVRERQNVFVEEEEELETYILSPTDTEGTVRISAWSVCDQLGSRRFVTREVKKTTLVASVSSTRPLNYINERHKRLLSMMERKTEVDGRTPRTPRKYVKNFLDDRISAEEVDLLEKKQAKEEVLKERRNTEMEEWWRDTVVAEGGVTQKAAAGSRSSNRRVMSLCLRWEFIRKTRRRARNPLGKSSVAAEKKKQCYG